MRHRVDRGRRRPATRSWSARASAPAGHRTSACSRPTRGRPTATGCALRGRRRARTASGPCPLPRLGLRLALPAALDAVEWFGRGPGEAYPDTRLRRARRPLRRLGRRAADAVRAPAGERQPHRGALGDAHRRGGAGLRVEGRPHVELTVAPLDDRGPRRRAHTPDLVAARPDLGQPRPRPAGHRLGLLRAGRAPPAPPRGRADDLRAAPQSGIPFARVTCAYQRALSFGVRSSVS